MGADLRHATDLPGRAQASACETAGCLQVKASLLPAPPPHTETGHPTGSTPGSCTQETKGTVFENQTFFCHRHDNN